jgi:cytochrome bd-type quinol oxidase subunit 2
VWVCWPPFRWRSRLWQAFGASIALFALSFLGIVISLWPMIVPGHFTL